MEQQTNHVELFLFSKDKNRVVLQRAPDGNYTGVFGDLKNTETPIDGANRVFVENTNMPFRAWRPEATLQISGDAMFITVFTGESDLLQYVCTSNKVVVDVFDVDEILRSPLLHKTTRWILLMCMDNINTEDKANVIYDGLHPQLSGAMSLPDFSKGLKIGIICNEYTDFNKLVARLRQCDVNRNNRFHCVLTTTNMYGLALDFYFIHLSGGVLLSEAGRTAVKSMQARGIKEDSALYEKYITPALW